MSSFFSKLQARTGAVNSFLCVGLDPHIKELFPDFDFSNDEKTWQSSITEETRCETAYNFCVSIVDQTAEHAAAYKPNAAFFEALGSKMGSSTLSRVIEYIKQKDSTIPILLDVKRGDIGSTAAAYADACYENGGIDADAVTLSPLMGWDSVKPFVTGKYSDKGAFVLCKTSNPGSNDILALGLNSGETVFEKIASLANSWSEQAYKENNPSSTTSAQKEPCFGLVVGSTDPDALSKARKAAGPNVWILAPGVGAQGGDLDAAVQAGFSICDNNSSSTGLLIPVSRGISRSTDRAKAAQDFKDSINESRARFLASVASSSKDESDSGVAKYQKDFIEFSLSEGVLKFGSFVLKSGRTSPYFFNAGLFASGKALFRLAEAYAHAIMKSDKLVKDGKLTCDVIFGPAYKGISLGAVVCASLYQNYGADVGYSYNRKEAKDHGEGGFLVGASLSPKKDGKKTKVLVIDDVITAGTAIRESYDMLTSDKVGAEIVGVVIALDRAEKRSLDDPVSAVQAVARDLSIPVVSIVNLPQLHSFLKQNISSYGKETLDSVENYRNMYGV